MYCKHCGNPNNEDSKFCQHCGKDISYEIEFIEEEKQISDKQIMCLSIVSFVFPFIPIAEGALMYVSIILGFISLYLINKRKAINIKHRLLFLILSLSGIALSIFWLTVIHLIK